MEGGFGRDSAQVSVHCGAAEQYQRAPQPELILMRRLPSDGR